MTAKHSEAFTEQALAKVFSRGAVRLALPPLRWAGTASATSGKSMSVSYRSTSRSNAPISSAVNALVQGLLGQRSPALVIVKAGQRKREMALQDVLVDDQDGRYASSGLGAAHASALSMASVTASILTGLVRWRKKPASLLFLMSRGIAFTVIAMTGM